MINSETEKKNYSRFIEVYRNYPQELAAIAAAERPNLAVSAEAENYNAGTMQKDVDIGLSDNIVIADAVSFENAFSRYKQNQPQMSDKEAKARVVFDFLQQHGAPFSYEQNKGDILWGSTTREQFYADAIYNNSQSNTNFFDRHIGNMQLLCLEPKGASDLPRNLNGLPQETLAAFNRIPPQERSEILLKRGLYHESLHMALGTTDERKCDAFALLKVMKEHPAHAKTIFDIYNMQRSKMGYTIDVLHKSVHDKNAQSYERAIKGGAMTYLMPNTYKKLAEYAQDPDKIPDGDAELLKLTCKLTAEVEFSKEQLNAFQKLIQQEHISSAELADNDIVQSCMVQGNFSNIDSYINSDNKLKEFCNKKLVQGYMPMAGENENTTLSADRVMAELIADVEQRWQQMDAYKRSVGTGIPFSQASDRWQNYIRDKISKEISQGKDISFDEALSRFEDFIREGAVVDHITENPSEDGNRLFALQSQMRGEKDAPRKSELQQQYNNLSKEIFAKLPEAEKTRLTDRFINDRIVPKHANLKAQAEINAPKEGYCLKGITASLYKINDKYGLGLLPENTPENELPGAFMQGLRDKDENAGKHIFHTNENQTFGQIAEREGIRPGAIIILDDSKGNPHHAMFWTGKRDENGEPQLIGFNGMGAEEESNVALSYAKNSKARVGTIIDIGGMVADSVERKKFQELSAERTKDSQENIASRLAEVRGKLAALRGNREEAENPTPEKTAATVKRREPQGQDKLNAALLNRMREQKMDGKP